MANFTCYTEMYVPLNADGTINYNSTGHYALRIANSGNGNMTVAGKSISNPIIDYGYFTADEWGSGYNASADGKLRIFPSSSFTNYTLAHGKFKRYQYAFTATEADVRSLITTIANCVGSDIAGSGAPYAEFHVTSGPFKNYTHDQNNCFTCLAWFCDYLGYSVLQEVWDAKDDVSDCYAGNTFDRFGDNWTYVGTYNL